MAFSKSIVINILQSNDNIDTAIAQIEALDEKKPKKYLLDKNHNPFAIYCYYHKQWELVSEMDYGLKSSSKTGLNTMCKLGVKKWTAQQKESVRAKSDLLVRLMEEGLKPEEIKQLNDEIDRKKDNIDLEGCINYSLEDIILKMEAWELNI